VSRIAGLINFLYTEKHMSPFEHGSFTFFVDTPLFVAREFMRHRTFSYNETSGRYRQLDGRFYVPAKKRPLIQKGKVGAYTFEPGTNAQFELMMACHIKAFEVSWTQYEIMLSNGIAKEVARNVLNLGLYTQFYATANPRNVMQFLILRNEEHALYEIREVAKAIEAEFAVAMPLTYAAFDTERETWAKLKEILNKFSVEELLELIPL
jgi:thymidylate synthase (FAD)